MRKASRTKKCLQYATWYEFRKALEEKSGRIILNWRWLEVKPKAPLPWNNSHMKAALLAVALLEKHKMHAENDRILLDSDADNWYAEYLHCSRSHADGSHSLV